MSQASPLVCAPWATVTDLPESRPDLTDPEWEQLLLQATEILWALSGRQWSGLEGAGCTASATLRDHGGSCGWWPSVGWDWVWGREFLPRGRNQPHVVRLPHDEVLAVDSVVIGGAAFTAWRAEGPWLYRTDGLGWSGLDVVVAYHWGSAPPTGGVIACVALALEFAKALTGDSACRLPKRVTSVTRQGMSMTLIDPQTFLKDGRTGLGDVDLWLVSVNPKARAERGSVWSPDVPRARRSG